MNEDYYAILGVSRSASKEQIQSAYRKIAIKTHPDKSPSEEENFRRATDAYLVLRDKKLRQEYDQQFRSITKTPKKRRATDIRVRFEVSTDERIKGIKKKFVTTRSGLCTECSGTGSKNHNMQKCPSCNGTGTDLASLVFKYPVSCDSCHGIGMIPEGPLCDSCSGLGTKLEVITREVSINPLTPLEITLSGSGNQMVNGDTGDLIVEVDVSPHPIYSVQGLNLYRHLEITPAQAILGDSMSIDVFGRQVQIIIPPNSKTGHRLELEGEGIFFMGRRGNLTIKLKIRIPEFIGSREMELYKELLHIEREASHGR